MCNEARFPVANVKIANFHCKSRPRIRKFRVSAGQEPVDFSFNLGHCNRQANLSDAPIWKNRLLPPSAG